MKGKHGFMWFVRYLNEDYQHLLVNYKKVLLYKELKDRSIHEYCKELSNYFLFLQERNIHPFEATTEIIQEYLDTFDVSNARMERIKSVLRGYYKHLKRRHYVKINPMLGLK